MKRIKIMMLSLALFAVIGGALAFKAKITPTPYCTTTTVGHQIGDFCPVLTSSTFVNIGATVFYYTTPYLTEVNEQLTSSCTSLTSGGVTTVRCFASTTFKPNEN